MTMNDSWGWVPKDANYKSSTQIIHTLCEIVGKGGTVRGMHFQREPHSEVKLVRCAKGAIWDVIIDIRPASPTFARWQGFHMTEENSCQLYIPEGFAHGFRDLGKRYAMA